MGELRKREGWAQRLREEDIKQLARSVGNEDYDLSHRDWLDLGRSGDPVAVAVQQDWGGNANTRVLKFLDRNADEKLLSLKQAWNRSPKEFRKNHLAEVHPGHLQTASGFAVLMSIAGRNLAKYQALSDLLTRDSALAERCSAIMRSILLDWNEGPRNTGDRTVSQVIRSVVAHREKAVIEWVRDHPEVRHSSPVDPLDFLDGHYAHGNVPNVFIGKAHGDLSGRNVLVPTSMTGDLDDYILIDYDHFADDVPLARDPMHLVVALVLDYFEHVGPRAYLGLIQALVHPEEDGEPAADRFRQVMTALQAAGEEYAESLGAGHDWRPQALLSLMGAGLVHLGRDLRMDDPKQIDPAKAWCYRLAAEAGEQYLLATGVDAVRSKPPAPNTETPLALSREQKPQAPERSPSDGVSPERTAAAPVELERLPVPLSPAGVGRIRDAMLAVNELRDDQERLALLAFLPDELRGAVRYSPNGHTHLLHLILTCTKHADGRTELLQALRIGVASSAASDRMFMTIHEEWPDQVGGQP